MDAPDSTGLSAIVEVVAGLPSPVQTSFVKACSDLLGGTFAYPAAWFKRMVQGVNDTTAGRSAVAEALARGVGEIALNDPLLMQAASEVFMPTEVRKVRNKLLIAQAAAARTSEMVTDGAAAAPPQDDWMNAFIRFAEDASSERLQDMFGRILAGEVVRPGSFSMSTLRIVSELDQSIAKDFSQVWEKSLGDAVDYSPEFQLGQWFSRWKRLAEAGLMAESAVNQHPPEVLKPFSGPAAWSPFRHTPPLVTVLFLQNCRSTWNNIEFTRAGRELGSILATPDYEANSRGAVARLNKEGIVRVDMHGPGPKTEILFAATGWEG